MQAAQSAKFSFKVQIDANKHQIATAINDIYKVTVEKVNIIKMQPLKKMIRGGRTKATIRSWKKAIVTLKKGQKIEGFEVKE